MSIKSGGIISLSKRNSLDVGGPESLHHLVGGEGAGGVALPADNLALGGEAELSGEVVFGLGRADVDVLEVLAVSENEIKRFWYKMEKLIFDSSCPFFHSITVLHSMMIA